MFASENWQDGRAGRKPLRSAWHGLWLVLGLIVALPAAHAQQQAANREQEMIRRLRQQLQSVQQQQQAIEQARDEALARAAAAEKDIAVRSEKADRLQRSLGSQSSELAATRARADRLGIEVETLRTRVSALEADKRQLESGLEAQRQVSAQRDDQKKGLESQLARSTASLAACENSREQLHSVGNTMLDEIIQAVKQNRLSLREPFTQVRRVELETRIEALRDRLDAAHQGKPLQGAAVR